jgi:serine/threonine protein kinase
VPGEDKFATDVFSYGIILYEILTGRRVFPSCLSPAKIWRMADASQVLWPESRPNIPDEIPICIRDVIKRCWDSRVDMRPSLTEILENFRNHLKEIADYLRIRFEALSIVYLGPNSWYLTVDDRQLELPIVLGAPLEPLPEFLPAPPPVPAPEPDAPPPALPLEPDDPLPALPSENVDSSVSRAPNFSFNPPRTLISFEPTRNKYLAEIYKMRDGGYFYEEYGQDLETLKRNERFRAKGNEYKLRIFKKTVKALISLGEGNAHRDLKPENILIDFHKRRIKITGYSSLCPGRNNYKFPEQYRAPELYEENHNLSHNVYFLGVLLYELITGQNFDVIASEKIRTRKIEDVEWEIAEKIEPLIKISFPVFRICQECLRIDPNKRLSIYKILSGLIFLV